MAKPDLISLQGEFFAALITNDVAGPYLTMGNTPSMQIAISSETTDPVSYTHLTLPTSDLV